ncbi:hypothetical protein [Methylobacterium isbiliense]|uniref:hypothetical protein n=1 Tax=Methylobacterium isbiliense TaxID=315478 RepID=UPI001EE21C07|nr:hypothetical protein [Methylobacterium isbiliense]MDN3625631.1 hypothetical protein [Methylobacterium isbiliense]
MRLQGWWRARGVAPVGLVLGAAGVLAFRPVDPEGAVQVGLAAAAAVAALLAAGAAMLALARRPGGRGIVTLARLGAAVAGLALALLLYPGLSRGLAGLLDRPEAVARTVIALGPHGRDVRLSGPLARGSADRLAALLAAHPGVTRLHLTSEGGLVDEGEALGALVAAHGLTTYVPDYCVSACTLVFLHGRDRIAGTQARLGFHAPYETGVFGEVFEMDSAAERRIYLATGVAPDFVDEALRVRATEIWIPPLGRLRAAGAVTAVVGTEALPDSTLDDDPTLAGARAAVLRAVPPMRPVADVAPSLLDAVAAAYLAAYRQGRSEAHGLDLIRRESARGIAPVLAGAPDAVVIDLGRLVLAALTALPPDDEACAALVREVDLAGAEEVLSRRGLSGDGTARTLVERALAGRSNAALAPPHPRRRGIASPTRHLGCGRLRDALAAALDRPGAAALRALLFPGIRPPRALEATALPPE